MIPRSPNPQEKRLLLFALGLGMVEYREGTIVSLEADIIVNAANTELIHSGGVARAIAQAAGDALERESRAIRFVPLGKFALTSAGNLRAKEVLHIPTIDYRAGGTRISYDILEKVWREALSYAKGKGYRSVATPLLGTGVVGLSSERVREILARVAEEFPELKIIIVSRENPSSATQGR